MSLQKIWRGEAKVVRSRVVLTTGPGGRQFFVRIGKEGQVRRLEVELTAEVEADGDVYLNGTLSAAQTASLSKGVTDAQVHATNPLAVLSQKQVEVRDAVGGTVAGVL